MYVGRKTFKIMSQFVFTTVGYKSLSSDFFNEISYEILE